MASIYVTSSTTTLRFTASGLSSDNVSRKMTVLLDGDIYEGSSTTGTPFCLITGLSPGTRYSYTADILYYTGGSWSNGYSDSGYAWTDEDSGGGGGGGGGGSSSWEWSQVYSGTLYVSSTYSTTFSLSGSNYVYYLQMQPLVAGTLQVYTTGSYDTYGRLAVPDTYSINDGGSGSNVVTGGSSYTNDDDSGDGNNFSYSYPVNAGTTYEIIAHPYSMDTYIDSTLWVIFTPAEATSWSWKYISSYSGAINTSVYYNLSKYDVGYVQYTPSSYGLFTAYSVAGSPSSFDNHGFLGYPSSMSLNTTASTGPTAINNYLASNDDGNGNLQFKIEYPVNANTTYRLAVVPHGAPAAFSGTLYLKFESLTSWKAPQSMYSIGSSTTSTSSTSTVPCYKAGYITISTPSTGKLVLQTTTSSTSPDFYSYLSTSTLSAASGTSRSQSVSGSMLTVNDNGGTNYNTKISYINNSSTRTFYWYVNAAWQNNGSYSIPWQYNFYPPQYAYFNYNYDNKGTYTTITFYTDSSYVLPAGPTRSGYIFKGWSTVSTAKTPTWKSGTSLNSSGSLTLYAVWWPEFNFSTYSYNELNTLIGYINNYLGKSIPTITSSYTLKLASYYNTIASALNLSSTATADTLFTQAQMDALATAYKNY